jgi:hypothetical protein
VIWYYRSNKKLAEKLETIWLEIVYSIAVNIRLSKLKQDFKRKNIRVGIKLQMQSIFIDDQIFYILDHEVI